MNNEDTVKLLRECSAGVKMGIGSLKDVEDKIDNKDLEDIINRSKKKHEDIETKIQIELNRYHDEEKMPNPMAKGMSWIKTNVMLAAKESDETVADLVTDGCNMGVKSLYKYLNKYENANQTAKDIAYELIDEEKMLTERISCYL